MPKRPRDDDVIDVTPPRRKVKPVDDVQILDDTAVNGETDVEILDDVQVLPLLPPLKPAKEKAQPKAAKEPKAPKEPKAAKPAKAPKAPPLTRSEKDAKALWKLNDLKTFNKGYSKRKFYLTDAELQAIPFTKNRILLHFGYGWEYQYSIKDLKAAFGSEANLAVRILSYPL